MSRAISICALFGVLLAQSGCLVSSHSEVKRSGTYVSNEVLQQVEPGKTSAAWVLATLGTPTEKSSVTPNEEVWKYSYTERTDSHGHVFLLFSDDDHKVTERKVFVELKDGIVTKCWKG